MQHPKKGITSDDIHSGRQLHPRSKLLNVLLTSAPLRSSWEIQTKAVLKSIAEMFPLCLNNRDLRALRGRRLPRSCSSLSPAQCSRNNRGVLAAGWQLFRTNRFSVFLCNWRCKSSTSKNSWSFLVFTMVTILWLNQYLFECPNLKISEITNLQRWKFCFTNNNTK